MDILKIFTDLSDNQKAVSYTHLVPFALALLESNTVITVAALSQLSALGDLVPVSYTHLTNPTSPNAPEPGKTPLSSMSPTIMEKDGEVFMVLGSPGATRIFTAMAQIISNVIDFGMGMDEAIESPRIHTFSSAGKAMPISIEDRISPLTIETLRLLGNQVDVRGAHDLYFGGRCV